MNLRVLKIVFNQLRVGSELILVFGCILWVQMISFSGLLTRGMPYLLLQLLRMLFSTITIQGLFTRILFLRLFRSFFCQALLLKYPVPLTLSILCPLLSAVQVIDLICSQYSSSTARKLAQFVGIRLSQWVLYLVISVV